VFEGTDACVAPILPLTEAMDHPHMAAREVFVEHEGIRQPAPAPRFSRTPAGLGLPPRPTPGADTRDALVAWGIDDVDALIEKGVAVQA
jgi:alpha-methylacyl-CoA racemase